MAIDEAFALVVRQEMDAQRLSSWWLAHTSGIPERTLRSILSGGGQKTVKLWHVCRIAEALGVPCAQLVARADDIAHR